MDGRASPEGVKAESNAFVTAGGVRLRALEALQEFMQEMLLVDDNMTDVEIWAKLVDYVQAEFLRVSTASAARAK